MALLDEVQQVQPDRVLELVGLPGTGKTALTIEYMASLLLHDVSAEIIILDNHGFFPSERLHSMLGGTDVHLDMMERVHVCDAMEPGSLIEVLESILSEPHNPNTRLLLVDNISYYFRHFRPDEMDAKMALIRYIGMLLRRCAREMRIPVIVHNHMSLAYAQRDRPETGMQLTPYLGDTWTFMLDSRIKTAYNADLRSHNLVVSKSPYVMTSLKPVQFVIHETGIKRITD